MATTIRLHTGAHYRGLPITVLGNLGGQLLAIAAYDTPQELAIATIAVKRRGGRRVYQVADSSSWTVDVVKAARAAAARCERHDAAQLLARHRR
ncbi:MAG: hypothetical protein M3296_06215 [Actinomycetota bacterium]|nr:hypothetical protein [Actinomycetota bacterium]